MEKKKRREKIEKYPTPHPSLLWAAAEYSCMYVCELAQRKDRPKTYLLTLLLFYEHLEEQAILREIKLDMIRILFYAMVCILKKQSNYYYLKPIF